MAPAKRPGRPRESPAAGPAGACGLRQVEAERATVPARVGVDGDGLSGLEYFRNGLLRGQDGERRSVKDALGRPVAISDPRATKPGARLELTLDTAIQDKVENVLAQHVPLPFTSCAVTGRL